MSSHLFLSFFLRRSSFVRVSGIRESGSLLRTPEIYAGVQGTPETLALNGASTRGDRIVRVIRDSNTVV